MLSSLHDDVNFILVIELSIELNLFNVKEKVQYFDQGEIAFLLKMNKDFSKVGRELFHARKELLFNYNTCTVFLYKLKCLTKTTLTDLFSFAEYCLDDLDGSDGLDGLHAAAQPPK